MPQSFACLHVHVIFGTKNREPLLTDDLRPRLFEVIGGICRERESRLMAAGGMPDHVHLVVSLDKQRVIADLVRAIKANASNWIHRHFPALRGFAWQSGYAAFSVSLSSLDEVIQYVENQAEHHRVRGYREEFLAFLNRHSIEYDERYLG